MCHSLNCSSLHYISRSSLNTLWIVHLSGNFSWNTPWPISFEILKSLYLFCSSFFEDLFEWIFFASNCTLFPAFNSCGFHLFLSNYFFVTSFTIFIDFFAASQLLCSPSKKFSSFGNSIFIVRFLFHECLPKLSLNEVCSITVCLLSLYWNTTADNHSIQFPCW